MMAPRKGGTMASSFNIAAKRVDGMKAPILIVLAGLSSAQAAEPEKLMLACQGTVKSGLSNDDKGEPISKGLVIDFAARTVAGFTSPGAFSVKILSADEASIVFQGSSDNGGQLIHGSINRVTGDVEADWTGTIPQTGRVIAVSVYSLRCKPAQRMF